MGAMSGNRATNRLRASVHTLGCRLNQAETGLIVERLQAAGYQIVPFGEPADLGIVNTCTVTREADAKSRQLVRSFIRKNPEAYTAVIGCYSQTGYEALADIEGVDLIVGNQEKLSVLDYVAEGKNTSPLVIRDDIQRDDFTIDVCEGAPVARRANLKIQDGCNFPCSYCVIPHARGRSRSREMGNLLEEARQLVERGAKEIVLTGVNIGTYNHEGATVLDVVNGLNQIAGLERIRISSIEPTTVPDGLLECMNDDSHALVPYLHLPLQSGSNRVLDLMRRMYTREEFREFVEMAAASVNDLCIGTDVMVGMPGETDEDFAATYSLLSESPVAYAHVFKYSGRDGTPAEQFPDKVDPQATTARSAKIRRLCARKRNEFNSRYLGKTVEVLFEQEENGWWSGHTGNYIEVLARSRRNLKNEMRGVLLERLNGESVVGVIDEDNDGISDGRHAS